jgi:hypothetical protein
VVGGRLLPGLRDRAPELDAFHGAWVDAYIDLVDFGHRAEDCTHVPPNCVPTLTACAALPPGWPEAVAQRLVVAMIKARRFQDHPFYSLDWGPHLHRREGRIVYHDGLGRPPHLDGGARLRGDGKRPAGVADAAHLGRGGGSSAWEFHRFAGYALRAGWFPAVSTASRSAGSGGASSGSRSGRQDGV